MFLFFPARATETRRTDIPLLLKASAGEENDDKYQLELHRRRSVVCELEQVGAFLLHRTLSNQSRRFCKCSLDGGCDSISLRYAVARLTPARYPS